MEFPSKLIENAVNEIAKLPGIGKKTALRLALHLLKEGQESTLALSEALTKMRTQIRYCARCHNISDQDICTICASSSRDKSVICVVQDTRDVLAIENTSQYHGLYHVLGGIIAPIEGVGPNDLHLQSLEDRAQQPDIREIILALPVTMEGDTTCFYITKKLRPYAHLKISTIARGVPVGGELEFADEITLGRSIISRVRYE
jgi:recombination protein RecR